MVDSNDFPHMLFYGPSGGGKKTRVMALLREVYGSGVEKMKVEHRQFKVSPTSSTTVDVAIVSSNYHIELTPADAGYYDRIVVQQLIKEMAQSHPLDSTGQRTFKVVVLNEVDRLSREAQAALRRTMEKYMSACRLVLVCQSPSKVIAPVRSRCLGIRVAAPTHEEIVTVLHQVSKQEGMVCPDKLAQRIAVASDRNLRRALLMLEACKTQQYPLTDNQEIPKTDWERYVTDIAKGILEEQSPKRLLAIRSKVYELLSSTIPPEMILKSLVKELMKKLDSELKHDVIHWAAYFEHRMQLGSKPIFHLEAFIARFMSTYKKYMLTLLG
eukprot:GILJ01007998.1.p1 GENE.GILJ01007998.1~~GILJ01007998.1.p1  ORF type:complete len:365 (-),score=49.20 GILJ01007998.1:159-1139(-)